MTTLRSRAPLADDRGQASVELALLLPVVALLLLTVLQVALLGRDVVLVTHASREAARVAATDSHTDAAQAAAADSSGLDPARLSLSITGRGDPGSRLHAEVTYRAPTDVPLVGALMGDHVIHATTTMRVETEE